MTANKDLKRHIRARQTKTGESYTTARAQFLHLRDAASKDRDPSTERITAIVLKSNDLSMRIRIPGEEGTITLRIGSEARHVAPGQLIEATLTKRWTWRGDAYASGSVKRSWIDIQALGLEPLPLEDQGLYNLREMSEPFREPEPYAKMWEFLVSVPRHAFELHGIAWGAGVGVDPDDHQTCLVADAADICEYDPDAARELTMKVLVADLRCIDAHAQLGYLCFDRRPEEALTHYSIAVGIGELSLGPNFDALLPWDFIYNRPFLRALHGYGLCQWRLGQTEKARGVFERMLHLNPSDNQGVRSLWDDIRKGRPWKSDKEETGAGSIASAYH